MPDQVEDLRRAFRAAGVQTPELHKPDKAKLWTTLEADLERWVLVGGFDKPNLSTEALAEFYEMMQRRREQA